MNDAELALTQARLNFNQSIYDYMVAKADLEKVLGNGQMNWKLKIESLIDNNKEQLYEDKSNAESNTDSYVGPADVLLG